MPTDLAFQARDWQNRTVIMTQENFQGHVPRHPEIVGYQSEAIETIADPDQVWRKQDGSYHLYRFGLGRGKFQRSYLEAVILYHSATEGVCTSYHFTRSLPSDWRGYDVELRFVWILGERVQPSAQR